MWHVRCLCETVSTFTGVQHFTIGHALRWTHREIVDAYQCANEAAYWLRIRSDLQPLVQRATLIRLEMTEADPAYFRRIDDRLHRRAHRRKQHSHAGMKQQRL